MTETEPAADLPEFHSPPPPNEALILELDGFEGPLDLLLALARHQKVDIAKISVLQLADQYLAFIEQAGRRKLELAADYLVMAAWLTFLKSRLVLPQPADASAPGADEMAAQLRWRLARLSAMREAAARLMARNRLDRDIFARGAPESVTIVRTRKYSDTLYDLLTAYSQQRIRGLGHRVFELKRARLAELGRIHVGAADESSRRNSRENRRQPQAGAVWALRGRDIRHIVFPIVILEMELIH